MKTQAILIAAIALLLGTEAGFIKPSPGTASHPLTDLTRPAPNTRKVLPNLVLSPVLAKALYYAQASLSSTIHKEAKLIHKVSEPSELVLDDLHIAIDDDISVKLSNVKLLSVPSIDVVSANPNLELLNLGLDIDFGTLQVGGNFEVFSKKILAEIPVTSSGEFILRNSPFKATGKVGLSLQTNFFKAVNYDVVYQPSGSYLTVSYLENNKRVVSGLEAKNQEAKVVAHINRHLKNVLNRLVQKRLDDILGAVPVDKLIGEASSAESYRGHARAVRAVANDYVDQVLEKVRIHVLNNKLSEIAVPDINQSFSKEILWVTWHGTFATSDGRARNLATLERTGDATLDIDANTGALIVSASLGLRELHIHYNHYEATFQDLGPSGSLTADVGRNSLFLKISVLLVPEISITLEEFRIDEATDISIEIDGLGILDWLVSHITTWVIDLFHDQIVGTLESELRQYIEAILPSISDGFI